MYTQENKSNDNKSRVVANSVYQKKGNGKQGLGFVDNRPEAIIQKKLQGLVNDSSQGKQIAQMQPTTNVNGVSVNHDTRTIQLVTVNVRNNINNYDSGWLDAQTQSTGVEDEPRAEAQSVADIAGGTWVGGHMVNDRLGGEGGFDNIVPITSAMNNQHHPIENAAQAIVGNGGTPYEVRYYMNILHRDDYYWDKVHGRDRVNNLAVRFQQSYKYRTKAVSAWGSRRRSHPQQPAGPETTVVGNVLDMDV